MRGELNIKVFGVGGGGGHTIEKLLLLGADDLDVIAVNTDAVGLLTVKAPKKLLIGMELTGGKSTGSDPTLGDKCARYDIGKIAQAVDGADIVFITCGLGGGTSSGVAPIIAERARTYGALTIAIVTLPFASEAKKTLRNAEEGLKALKLNSDAVIVIKNEKLLQQAPHLPLKDAFKLTDETTAGIIRELSHLTIAEGLHDMSVADLRSVLSGGKTAYVGVGAGRDFIESAKKALSSPLIDADVSESCGALVYVSYGVTGGGETAEDTLKFIASRLPEDAVIIWGAKEDDSLGEDFVKTVVVLCQRD
jgi:cell division protein FtsZ